jgi:phosphoribosylformimino-5-aminoimidazole carboxamide ribotide isomerase
MLTIIPAIDIIEGKCVRLAKGDYSKKIIYNNDPLDVAMAFEDHGLMRLHLVDLDGAKGKHVVNWKVLERIATKTKLIIDFGGGIKSDKDIETVFRSGAAMVTIGSIALKESDLFFKWLTIYGNEKIILGADVKNRMIAVTGWLEETEMKIFDMLAEYSQKGVLHVLCTDISKDGMLEGTSMDLYKEIRDRQPEISLIASGGISKIDELIKLDEMKVSGAIIGKAIYEGNITLKDLQKLIEQLKE